MSGAPERSDCTPLERVMAHRPFSLPPQCSFGLASLFMPRGRFIVLIVVVVVVVVRNVGTFD